MGGQPPLEQLGRGLLLLAGVIALVGLALLLAPKLPFLGRLPGDIVVRRRGFTFYAPLATSLIVSLVVSFLLWLFRR